MCNVSCVTCHVSHVTCQMADFFLFIDFFLTKQKKKKEKRKEKKEEKKKKKKAGPMIRIGREIQCLPYAGFLMSHFNLNKISWLALKYSKKWIKDVTLE